MKHGCLSNWNKQHCWTNKTINVNINAGQRDSA